MYLIMRADFTGRLFSASSESVAESAELGADGTQDAGADRHRDGGERERHFHRAADASVPVCSQGCG